MENDLPTEEQVEQLSDDVATVADEILVEVKECRTQQRTVAVDLERLREEGQENSRAYQELMTEFKNLREENRSLTQELKALLESRLSETESIPSTGTPTGSPSSIPSTSLPTTEMTVINPVGEEGRAEPPKAKKRYKI